MKPINAYLNIHNGKVVASTVEKPVLPPQLSNHWETATESGLFKQALKEFESSILGEVENQNYQDYYAVGINLNYIKIEFPNYPCQVEVKGKEVTVIKLVSATRRAAK